MGAKSKQVNKRPFKINRSLVFNPRCYQMFSLGVFAFLVTFVASAVLTPVSPSSAADPAASTIDISNQYNGRYLRFSAQRELGLNISAVPEGTISAVTDNLSIATNVGTGYKLSIATTTSDIYNSADVDKVSRHFSPVEGTIAEPAVLDMNTWGFKLDSVAAKPGRDVTWAAVPTDTTVIRETETATTEEGESVPISYGFAVDTTLPAGSYQAEILYTVYAEYAEEFPTMQEFTIDECNNMQTNEITTLTDSRDGKSYRVTKYADGNCWMSQNLALDGTTASGEVRTLTPADSDVTEERRLAANSTSGTSVTEVKIYSGKATDATSTCDLATYPYCIESSEPYGNLYNWYAATATTGVSTVASEDAPDSVCPKGWKLPTSGNMVDAYGVNAPDKSYGKLMYSALGFDAAGGTGHDSYAQDAQRAPLYFPLSGYFVSSGYDRQGGYGYYWSRTAYSDNLIYNFHFNTVDGSNFYPQNFNVSKSSGASIRCVFDPPVIEDNMYMQDVTTTMCSYLSETTAEIDNRKTLIDSRDNKTYRVAKLADGNCWMVQNLALDPVDGEGKNRTLTTADTNIDTAEIAGGEYTFPDGTLISSGTQYASDKEQIYNADATKTTTSCNTTTNPYCLTNSEPYGNYYNWMSAVLGIDTVSMAIENVNSSICPKNWRLPNSGTAEAYGASAPDKSYGKLMYSVLGFSAENATGATGGAYVKAIQQAPLYFPLAGYYSSSLPYAQGSHSNYWSRNSGADVYHLGITANTGLFFPQSNGLGGQYGFSVRCVLGDS